MFLLNKRGFRELPSAPRPFSSLRATAVQERERETTFLTLGPPTKNKTKKRTPILKCTTTLVSSHLSHTTRSHPPLISLCHSPSALPVPILPAPCTAWHCPAPRGGNAARWNPSGPKRATKPPELNTTGEWQQTVDLSLHQSVWVCQQHLFNMTQK